jgi:hypothetical protein
VELVGFAESRPAGCYICGGILHLDSSTFIRQPKKEKTMNIPASIALVCDGLLLAMGLYFIVRYFQNKNK